MSNKGKNILMTAVLVVLALLMLPVVVTTTHGAQTDSQYDEFDGCVVAGGETTVTLTQSLWQSAEDWVTAMTATGDGADPGFDGYVPATKALTIDGLGVDTPQDVTVTYDYGVMGDFTGLEEVSWLVPLLFLVGVVLAAVFSGYRIFRDAD